MSRNYKFHNPEGLYFVSFSVVEWLDVFTRNEYKNILIESLAYCQSNKGMEIVADHGKIFNITGSDGQQYKLIQSLGSHHGKSGVFELIINKGLIHHQRFIPGGLINGIPNQVVPGISPSVSPGIRWWK